MNVCGAFLNKHDRITQLRGEIKSKFVQHRLLGGWWDGGGFSVFFLRFFCFPIFPHTTYRDGAAARLIKERLSRPELNRRNKTSQIPSFVAALPTFTVIHVSSELN